jgi:hypothetical protein
MGKAKYFFEKTSIALCDQGAMGSLKKAKPFSPSEKN